MLEGLAATHEIEVLVTRPDRPRGRGRKVGAPPAKEVGRAARDSGRAARAAGLVSRDAPVVVAAYGALIPSELLEDRLWLNVHPSLLPRWRGAAPVERALMAGDPETGVTIHRTTAELDAGPIAARRAFPIGPDDDAGVVYERAARSRSSCWTRCCRSRRSSRSPRTARRTRRRSARPTASSTGRARRTELHNRIRALAPHIGARGEVEGRPVIVWRSRLADDGIEILEVQPEGKRRMTLDEFLRGLR